MDERRRDQGFAVVTQSVSGGPGGGRRGPGRIGVVIVAVASLALVTVGFVGPRLTGLPNFDIAYFATPTPRATARPTPTPTPTRPGATPVVTPLPELTRPDDVPPLDGELVLAGESIQRFDLATGKGTRLQPMALWQDAVTIDPDGRILCVCVEDGVNDRGATRTVRLVRITDETAVSSQLATFESSPESFNQQPDPLIDVVVDRAGRSGLLALVGRTTKDWRVSIRVFDARNGEIGPEIPIGQIVVPPLPKASGAPSASPNPGLEEPVDSVYVDGPHVRRSSDGRTAFVWATGQRYNETDPPVTAHGAWRIRFDASGAVQDVAEAPDLVDLADYCSGWMFAGPERFAALCTRMDDTNSFSSGRWDLHLFDVDGGAAGSIAVPSAGEYGWGEPLVDEANGRIYLWDPIELSIVRMDIASGSVTSATFDPAATSVAGVTSGAAQHPPAWHDGDSAVQQFLFETLTGAPDGSRLFAVGFHPDTTADLYTQKSYGVFVIDPATLGLVQHWAPVTNDAWVAPIAGDRVAIGGQPGMNAEGQQVPWQGSLTIRQAADGRILARYGDVSSDMPPVLVRP